MTDIKGFFDDYRYLSNFHLCRVNWRGFVFPSSENAYQWAKIDTIQYSSDEYKTLTEQFLVIAPNKAKNLGQKVMILPDWLNQKLEIMEEIVRAKFTQNEDIRAKLIATGDSFLEETNWWGDKFFGVCNGVGENHLGKILMKVRGELNNGIQHTQVD